MLHEARDRQKFVSDVQYLRDMQHKVDSEYQACLRRHEFKKDPSEKKRDQFGGQDTSERTWYSSGSSSKQTVSEEDSVTEPRYTRLSSAKCDARLPAIDQASVSVKQKHKSTMTLKKPEKAGPSKPSPVTQTPKILSRKRRPNLGRLTVSPEMSSPRVSGERSRQKSQLPAKVPALVGAAPVVQPEGLMFAGETKLKRPSRERKTLAPPPPLVRLGEKAPERPKKGEPSVLSQKEPHSALSQPFQAMKSEPLGSPLIPSGSTGATRRGTPFRFRDEDFYSTFSINVVPEGDDTEEEIQEEEQLLLAGMRSPRSPSNQKRNPFLGTATTQAQNNNFEENAENSQGTSLRRSEPKLGSLRIHNTTEPVTKQQDSELADEEPANENDSDGGANEQKTESDTKSQPRQDDDLSAEDAPCNLGSTEAPGVQDYERDWQDYLNGSRNSFDCLLSGRPTVPRSSSLNSYHTPGSLMHSALIDDIPVDLSVSSILVHGSELEENSRFNARRPLSPIRSRNPFANTENHNIFLVNTTREFDIRGAERITLTSQPQGASLYAEDFLLNPQGSLSLADTPRPSLSRMDVQGHLHMPESLQEAIPFTFFAVSDFTNQNDGEANIAVSGFTDEKGETETKADPEKLKKLQESLLEEDSEEEGDLCRICQIAGGSPTNPLLEPCGCVGSLQFVHQECLKKWLKVKITSGADLGTVKTCEMCKQGLLVDLDDFNMTEFYQKHQQSRAQNELMNSGLYLVLLLHLYEQRFAELMRLNYRRVSRERLSRNHPQPRPEENESSESGDGNESTFSSHVV
ncbi:probable E3 ubiquitin-protein ligase MARCHF10 isoform X1 [Perognathus longimembris pacificus]|uniref:probable E3 ubiquitin-protein ligase MARCHF10 isoform X1 n=1 Tax=Perognathus longimembris pacificus TaxID=214514 RepID=UPI0020196A6D|nr:probable E3 ubiquitin-protein ligase MARCHF10 isoform X1 [Perognathus longimembris pacificus]